MTDRPNILVMLTDDHAQWALGCSGNREIRTPTFDYLAATGVRMANAFTPTPVCSPARASFWTGLRPSQHGIHDYLYEQDDQIGRYDWLDRQVTLAEILSQAGYQVGFSGKWHCGRGDIPQPGFEYWFSRGRQTGRHFARQTYWDHDRPVEIAGFTAGIIGDYAIRFLRERDRSRPFFLFVGHVATHSPWEGHPERLVDMYRTCTFDDIPNDLVYPFGRLAGESTIKTRYAPREARAQYYAAVSELDEQAGRLLDELEAQGIRENTLVVYTADHGLNCGHHGIWGKGNGTRPLNMVEESIRVPLILNQPGTLFGGQVRGEFVDHCDLFQTLLDHAGVTAPEPAAPTKRYPGRSYRPLLMGRAIDGWRDVQHGEYGNVRMLRTRTHKLVRRYPDGPDELFDLRADPRETTSLFDDPAQRALITELSEQIAAYYAEYEDPAKSGLRVHELPVHNPVEAWRDAG